MEEKYKPKNSCEQANLYCDKLQYNEIGFWDKLRLNFHLLFCGPCQQYSKKNTTLTKMIKKANAVCLSSQEIDRIKESVNSGKKT